jgi:hypothetical protein
MKKLIILLSINCLGTIGFGQTPTFSSNFEDQNMDAEIGKAVFETGTSGGYQIVSNPLSDDYNSSSYVMKVYTLEGTGGRAEYQVPRHETLEKTYIYRWKRYYPDNMWTDISGAAMINQWKTYPCTAGLKDVPASSICGAGGGIFNDMSLYNDWSADYRSRAAPDCRYDFTYCHPNMWHEFTLEIYWTQTETGYYRLWRNDTLVGYSDSMKTMFNEFVEDDCDIYWTTGLYTGWWKAGDETQDSLIAYLDDIRLYDVDSGYTVADLCPACEVAPATPTDSNVYKVNTHFSKGADDGYNNYIVDWNGDTSKIDMANTYGQSNGIDLYLWSGTSSTSDNLSDECFPDDVINSGIYWSDTNTHVILLKDLNPNNTYKIKILAATSSSGTNRGTQIWTTEENRDTVFAANNTCNMTELSDLVSDESRNIAIYVKSIADDWPRAYINAIEIVEYVEENVNSVTPLEKSANTDMLLYPNPVKDNLKIKTENIPLSIAIYSIVGRRVKYAENTNSVNVSDLRSGIYLVMVDIQETFVTGKIIKE